MASTKLAAHIPTEAHPQNVSGLIVSLAKYSGTFENARTLLEWADTQGIGNRTEIQSMSTDMGLITKDSTQISVSPMGQAFVALREEARPDILHGLLYTGWDAHHPSVFAPSWAYRYCCNHYYASGELALTSTYVDRLIQEVVNAAEVAFAALGIEVEGISFSRKSISGAHKWLEALHPEVFSGEGNTLQFARRSFAPPELVMFGLGYLLKDEPDALEADVLLTHEKREALCQLLLLEPNMLDPTLDYALNTYPHLAVPGTSAGYYGRFIRFNKIPTLSDLVR